jgi:hypothetical protein
MPSIRADFASPACLTPDQFDWVPSPQSGVDRVLLDRQGDEVAVATSLVRYAPDSRFPPHEHARGEEFLVLEGEFGDEYGRYPPGTYVRNPPGTRHTPFSEPGCVIWVKLRQFHPDDGRQFAVDARVPVPTSGTAARELHRFDGEVVTAFAMAAGATLALPVTPHVQELLVIHGAIDWQVHRFDAWGWLRVPVGERIEATALMPTRLLHKTRPAFALP